MRDDRAVRIVTDREGVPPAAGEVPSERPTRTGHATSGSSASAAVARDTPANRNGVPLLPFSVAARRVSPEAVDRLRDEI
jgi:hypothetical protein